MKPTSQMVVCYPFVGDTIGGSHLSTLTLINNLERRNKTKIKPLIVVHQEGKFSRYLQARNIEYTYFPLKFFVGRYSSFFKKIFSFLYVIPKVSSFILRHKIDIIHTNDARMHLTWSLPSKLTTRKHIWHQRTLWSQGRIPKLLFQLAKEVICLSFFVESSLPKRKNTMPHVICNPVRIAADRELMKSVRCSILSHYEPGWKGYIVTNIGNLQAVKQPLLFIKMALEMLKLSSVKLHFVIVGEDRESYIPKMEELIQKVGCSEEFSFMGFRDDVAEIIAISDLVVACSKADAFGRTIIESMSLKTPVVAIDAGGHGEIIKDKENGFLFSSYDPTRMAELSLGILNNIESTSVIVENAKKFSDRCFDDAMHADNIIDVYSKAVGKKISELKL